MATMFYPLDIGSGDYGNTCVVFQHHKRDDPQGANAAGGAAAANIIPPSAQSGMPVLPGFGDLIDGILDPIKTFIKENPLDKFTGSIAGTITTAFQNIKEEIVMYVPADAGTNYQAKWEEQNAPVAGAFWEAATGGTSTPASIANGILAAGGAGALQAVGAGNGGATDFFMSKTGNAPNPNKQLYFKDMEFRKHQFTFHLYAKSKQEADNISQIIYTFKLAMHPSVGTGASSFLYGYPDWFDIKYYVDGKLNPYMHRIKRSILESMDVKYAPEGLFVSHQDGSPTHIVLTLAFKELEVLTKESFERYNQTH